MKRNFLILAPAALFLTMTGLIFTGPVGVGQNSVKAPKGIVIPADLDKIFTNSCMPCHSTNGKEMAKTLLNFSRWDKYARRAQVQKSRAICRKITKDEMPPAQFKESNPELALTRAQKDSICKWVNLTVLKKE